MQPATPDLPTILGNTGVWTLLRLHVVALVYLTVAAATCSIRRARARELDAARPEGQLAHLAELFQRVQRTTSRPLVSLEEELETVEAYLTAGDTQRAARSSRAGDALVAGP